MMLQRRLAALALVALIALAVGLALEVVRQHGHLLPLPLEHTEIIRKEAAAKHLDPALIAAVIYAETKFVPRTSPTGAEGLMQIEPDTALFLAHLSGAQTFTLADLATPSVNIAYGSYYLRYLLDHYHGDETLALAAYNGGEANADKWAARARASGGPLEIPFPETRAYVQRVKDAQATYRSDYAGALGIA